MAVGGYSAVMDAFLAYSIPAALPIIIRFLFIRDEVHLTVGGVILVFSIMMFFTAKGVNSTLKTSLTFKQTYSKSVARLKERQGATHEQNYSWQIQGPVTKLRLSFPKPAGERCVPSRDVYSSENKQNPV